MNPDVLDGPVKSYLSDTMNPDVTKACVKVSDDMVRYELKKQYFVGLSVTGTLTGGFILPAHRYQPEKFKGDDKGFAEHFNKHAEHAAPVLSGMYKFSKWEHGKIVELVRNDDWWGCKANVPWIDPLWPYLDKLQFIIINNKNAALKALENGEVDADFEIEQLTWKDKETNSDDFKKQFARAQYTQPIYTYIGWNMRRPDVDEKHQFFKDKKVRLAMTMLIDRQKILDDIHFGLGEDGPRPLLPERPVLQPLDQALGLQPGEGQGAPRRGRLDRPRRRRDPRQGRRAIRVHLQRAQREGLPPQDRRDRQAGYREGRDQGQYQVDRLQLRSSTSSISRKFDAMRFALGDPDCVDSDPYQEWHSSQWDNKGSNTCGYSNAEVDEICVRARRELDFRKRQRMFRRMDRSSMKNSPTRSCSISTSSTSTTRSSAT